MARLLYHICGGSRCTQSCVDFNVCLLAFLVAIPLGVFEVYGGFDSLSNSLLADAGHVFSDAIVYGGIAWAVWRTSRRVSHESEKKCRHWGANFLIFACIANIILACVRGAFGPEEVFTGSLLWYAGIGLAANVFMVSLFWRHTGRTRAAFLHTVGDTAMSIVVMVGAVLNKSGIVPFRSGIVDVALTIFGSLFLICLARHEKSEANHSH